MSSNQEKSTRSEKIISDIYRIEGKLGEGGPSVVFRGTDLLLDIPIAIKQLKQGGDGGLLDSRRFLREARTQAKLVHQNIVTIRAIVEEDKQYFIIMEFIDGRTLEDMIDEPTTNPRLSVTDIIDYGCQTLKGLGYAHQKSVLHRDIKPANIMITHDGYVKLADFGIAREIHDNRLTQTGAVLGTPAYMSPEQIRGLQLDYLTDIYSFGVTLYECVSGFTPFDNPSLPPPDMFEMMRRHLMDEPISLIKLGIDIPPDLDKVIQKSMAKDPAERYSSCGALIEALQAIETPKIDVRPAALAEESAASENVALLATVEAETPNPVISEQKRVEVAIEEEQKEVSPSIWQKGLQFWKEAETKVRIILVVVLLGSLSLLMNLFFLLRPSSNKTSGRTKIARTVVTRRPTPLQMPVPRVDQRTKTVPHRPIRRTRPQITRKVQVAPPVARRSLPRDLQGSPNGISAPAFPLPDARKDTPKRSIPQRPRTALQVRSAPRSKENMVKVEQNCFTQGQPSQRRSDAAPARRVCLGTYWIDRFEVSVKQYLRCVKEKGCKKLWIRHWFKWRDVSRRLPLNNPIAYAHWKDAVRFCKWAGKRLPTEAEWEHAARGYSKRIYPWGNTQPTCRRVRNARCRRRTSSHIGRGIRAEGKSFYGLYDMAGSVSEWVMDCYDRKAYRTLPLNNPLMTKRRCYKHVIRGGSWYTRRNYKISTYYRSYGGGRRRRADYGFRCAWSAKQPKASVLKTAKHPGMP